ncbi:MULTISPECIES: prefoldin subunit alpha [Archaeoglobus]|jgi:prefoldin alpha subunit|uniref:Prefoldin subunit alpha n=2 Tax=Archaeoglobus fulgidus TaxID=2234 RepID=PFDA_ARCFU|nr:MULTISPECIES: prefoldin subunit alpha [Archaeoglobus]O28216.1 RecName: Full=Prefoldin subunit alpha; AltName: Full=GimC subunit alpha [Archaeoglobus fulgidus DSM 4304]AAB89209.1 c-myc binding protein, putative [Archaeoglobus fulgidus DSM 4304]KUJ93379.1 MAG: Prefoldin subunit alpha [Archaeoglobus fulgidus]KUK06674.1 MAG: Prefoldin subunit alpha [Archaeoglobus fulgidus]MDI3496912.1 prefoldin alpha subunit [Archaeoglobus sp.]
MSSEKEVQEKIATLQILQEEAEALQRRLMELEILENEYRKTLETLEFFESIDTSVEALMNLGGGVFAYVDVKNSKKMLVDIGSGVVVEREVGEAIEFVKNRIKKIEENQEKMTSMLQQVLSQAQRIQQELAARQQKE